VDENAENFEFDRKIDNSVYGHPNNMKRIELMSKEDIETEAESETTFKIPRNQIYISEMNDREHVDYTNVYELIELAPLLFQNIRKMSKISNGAIKKIFSLKNLEKLEISATQGKGGSFFIRPANGHGKVLIKSITIPEYNIMKKFLPDYYCHLLMNSSSYLVPILGVYKMRLHKNSDAASIVFMLMRDALDISRYELGSNDRMFTFDLKGSLYNRQVLANPADIFEMDADYEDYKDVIFKDIDFLQSFTKLDITNLQSEKIMSQLKNDVELLNDNNFMDYSLLMFIIIRPYSCVKAPVDYVSTGGRSPGNVALDEIKEFHEDSDSGDDKPVTQGKEEKKSMTDNRVSRFDNVLADHVSSESSPDKQDVTYVNRKTGQKEILNMFKVTTEGLDLSHSRNSEAPTSPLKDLAYYDNKRRKDLLSGNHLQSSGGGRNSRVQHGSTLYISQSHVDNIKKEVYPKFETLESPNYDGSMLVLKEKVNKKLQVFHICEKSDIYILKGIEANEQNRNNNEGKIGGTEDIEEIVMKGYTEKDEEGTPRKDSLQEEGKKEYHNSTLQLDSELSQSSSQERDSAINSEANQFTPDNLNKNPYYRLSSVLNFERKSKQLQADTGIAGVLSDMDDSSTVILERSNISENSEKKKKLEKKLQEIDNKIQCEFCNANYRQNHILEIDGMFEEREDTQLGLSMEEQDIWKGMVQREKIEQLIFDPKLGMVKREVHFGIIDYLTTFSFKKRLEEKLKKLFQNQPSAVNPNLYSERFLDFSRNIFK
jgi:hypothetical protein